MSNVCLREPVLVWDQVPRHKGLQRRYSATSKLDHHVKAPDSKKQKPDSKKQKQKTSKKMLPTHPAITEIEKPKLDHTPKTTIV